ncbi:unnamed protein product [Symbiodinium natans]|uniref:Glycosyl transferase family 1 domain-containing protein n=1 Tax=Symbiodinium natans TaxID=878477 RepID=A0A812N4X8_9DINO|nr:unnamed protein product [Symbiodinium natans]
MVHNHGTVLLAPQNLAVSGANQVLHNIVAGNFFRGNIVLVAPSTGPFASKFQEFGVSIRIGKVEDILDMIRDIRFAICNTIMTAHIVKILQRRGVPCAWILHEWWTKEMIPEELQKRNDKNLTVATVEEALQTCSATVAVCERQLHLYGPAHGEVIFVGTPDVDPSSFPALKAPGGYPSGDPGCPPKDVTTFLCIGIVCPRKNQAFTVKCFKKFAGDRKDVELLVVGVRKIRDYEIAYVEQVEKEIGGDPRIQLHDVTHEVDKYYAKADVVLLASLNEVTPMVLAESMARKTPVITTGIAGIPEMLTDGVEGFICGEEDTDACAAEWAKRMKELADDPALRHRMGEAGLQRYAKQFRLQHMVDQYRMLAMRLAKPIILIDMDGVLVDWDKGFLKAWADRTVVDRSHYEMEKCVPPERFGEAVELFCSEGFFRNLPEMPDGVASLKEMVSKGFEVLICTAPFAKSRYCAQEKWEWVREHLGDEWLLRMVITQDKTTVRGDVLIDDKPKITGSQIPLWKQVVFDAQYNRNVEMDGRRRLCAWKDWEKVLAEELPIRLEEEAEDDQTEASEASETKPISEVPSESTVAITAEEVAKLRDFSAELEGSSFLKDYRAWRLGKTKGAKGEFWQAVADIERIKKQLFLEGDDWSSVHVYRHDYGNWRRGRARGAKATRAEGPVAAAAFM